VLFLQRLAQINRKSLKKTFEPRLEEAKSGKRIVFFLDAAYFVPSPYIGFLWCFTRMFIKSPSGRNCFNLLGALNAIIHELIVITDDKYINACSFCELLWNISCKYANINIPITLVLDNARYQKCKLVFYFAKLLDIELVYLSTYSLNLNLIERLWKFVKKKCLFSKYYPDFRSLKGSISDCISKTHTEHKKELSFLLTLNFKTFKKDQMLKL